MEYCRHRAHHSACGFSNAHRDVGERQREKNHYRFRQRSAGPRGEAAGSSWSSSAVGSIQDSSFIFQRKQPIASGTGTRGATFERKVWRADQDSYRLQGEEVAPPLEVQVRMSGFNIQELMSQAKKQYEALQKKMQEIVVE